MLAWRLENRGLQPSKSRPRAFKIEAGASKIEARSLQNRAWSPPRRHFYKTCNLRRLWKATALIFCGPRWPTWLQLGGPRGSKIEAKTLKNRCWKKHRFWHRFLKGSDVVFEWFWVGFSDPKRMRKAKMRFWCNINKTLRGRMNFEVRLLQQATKIEPKSIQKCMFLGSAISEAFWKGLGDVLGRQNR